MILHDFSHKLKFSLFLHSGSQLRVLGGETSTRPGSSALTAGFITIMISPQKHKGGSRAAGIKMSVFHTISCDVQNQPSYSLAGQTDLWGLIRPFAACSGQLLWLRLRAAPGSGDDMTAVTVSVCDRQKLLPNKASLCRLQHTLQGSTSGLQLPHCYNHAQFSLGPITTQPQAAGPVT